MNGLIIREPWISHILSGAKTWEMRTTPTRYRGPIGLIRPCRNLRAKSAVLETL